MIFENKIIEYFSTKLIKRELKFTISEILTKEDNLIISEIGLPNDVLDFHFVNEICLLSKSEAIIGNTSYDCNVILNLKSRNIIKENSNFFLAKSLKHLVLQLYVYDCLWNNVIPNNDFGPYRENSNHKKYAKFLERELLKIDQDLLKNDNGYFWGSLIEDIEFGIVG
jgi:hypothetical protein